MIYNLVVLGAFSLFWWDSTTTTDNIDNIKDPESTTSNKRFLIFSEHQD